MGFIENINQLFGLIFWGRVLGLCIRAAAQKCAFLITSFRAHSTNVQRKDISGEKIFDHVSSDLKIWDLKIWYQGRNDFKVQFYFRPNYQRSRIKGHFRSFLGQRFNFKIKLLYCHIIIIILFLIILSKTLKGYLFHVRYPKMKFNLNGVGNWNFK